MHSWASVGWTALAGVAAPIDLIALLPLSRKRTSRGAGGGVLELYGSFGLIAGQRLPLAGGTLRNVGRAFREGVG